MVAEGLFLASHGYFGGFYGGAIGNLLSVWEQAGVFSYILPFLLIFAVVFGILMQTKMFQQNRTINGIIALTVSLLSLQFAFVPVFFSEIFSIIFIRSVTENLKPEEILTMLNPFSYIYY